MKTDFVRRLAWPGRIDPDTFLTREWLVTNGLGGYASGSLGGVATRRYHGLLVAALPSPLGRTVMLNHLTELLRRADGSVIRLGGEEPCPGQVELGAAAELAEFRLELGVPVWRYEIDDLVIEKQLFMPYRRNTVYLTYRLLAGRESIRLELRPELHLRGHDSGLGDPDDELRWFIAEDCYELRRRDGLPPLRLRLIGHEAALTVGRTAARERFYRVEADRGYDSRETLRSSGRLTSDLHPGGAATLVASTESWETIGEVTPEEAAAAERDRRERLLSSADPRARSGPGGELVLAADQFIVTPARRETGEQSRTVIAGYHWFTDWGRDTMISLEGLTLTTGRSAEAGVILRTFAREVREGLIPNLFPEGEQTGLYNTADATLWFFHALDRYLQATGDHELRTLLLPTLREIVAHHLQGTRYGIGVDPQDGLLRQGAPGTQLTWMDAKVGDWVVTPRRGKAVEINALWYNALRLLARWSAEDQDLPGAESLNARAEQTRQSFNRRFWSDEVGYLYDVVDGEDGDDRACRPNQLLAISLEYPVLNQDRWASVLQVVAERLLTPVGLRSLSPDHPDYHPRYQGDLHARDAAYHQGTVWAWLIGPFIDAWLKVHPQDREAASRLLEGFEPHLGETGLGSISEIFDGQEPFTPRGCVAQAWSVAEVLRCWVKVRS